MDNKNDNNKKEGKTLSLFNFPEVKFGLQWEFDDPVKFAKNHVLSDREKTPRDEERPLAHSIGFTIPSASFAIPLPDSPRIPSQFYGLKGEFPAFARYADSTFLDNASRTQLPQFCISRIQDYSTHCFADPAAEYPSGQNANHTQWLATETERLLMNDNGDCGQGEVVSGATVASLNHSVANLLLVTMKLSSQQPEVIVSETGHDSVRLAWNRLANFGVVVKLWKFNPSSLTPLEELESLLTTNTRAVVLSHVNWVTGEVADLKKIVTTVKTKSPTARVIVEGSQFVGHRLSDVSEWQVDFYMYAIHNFFGPHYAILCASREAADELRFNKGNDLWSPLKEGAGCPAEILGGRLGLHKYFERVCQVADVDVETDSNFGNALLTRSTVGDVFRVIQHIESVCLGLLLDYLMNKEGVRVFGHSEYDGRMTKEKEEGRRELRRVPFCERQALDPTQPIPIVSFVHDTLSSADVAAGLRAKKVWCAVGDQGCGPLCDGLKANNGIVSLSLSHYTTPEDVDVVVDALESLFHA